MRKKATVLSIGLVVFFLSSLPAQAKKYQIALLMSDDRNSKINTEILNAATSALFESKRFTVIERAKLDAIFAERDLEDFINGSPGDLSNLEGVDMLGLVTYSVEKVTGGDGRRYSTYYIDIRMTSVTTGEIVGTASSRRSSFSDPTTPHEAGRNLLQNVREMFPPEGYVVSVAGEDVIVDLGLESGIKKGDQLEIIREGETHFHPVTGKPLPAVEHVIGVLKVVDPTHQMSHCKLNRKKKQDAVTSIDVADRVRLKAKKEGIGDFFKSRFKIN